jgi:hypothetical protein
MLAGEAAAEVADVGEEPGPGGVAPAAMERCRGSAAGRWRCRLAGSARRDD